MIDKCQTRADEIGKCPDEGLKSTNYFSTFKHNFKINTVEMSYFHSLKHIRITKGHLSSQTLSRKVLLLEIQHPKNIKSSPIFLSTITATIRVTNRVTIRLTIIVYLLVFQCLIVKGRIDFKNVSLHYFMNLQIIFFHSNGL